MLIQKELKKEKNRLDKLLKDTIKELSVLKKKVPEGAKLRVGRSGNTTQYYLRKSISDKTGTYIRKKDSDIANILAQIEYDEKLIAVLEKEIKSMGRLMSVWIDDPFSFVNDSISPSKRELITRPNVSDEDFVLSWLHQEFTPLSFREGFPEYYNKRGLRVRSKSEVIIADILDDMHVPFLYEKPLMLGKTMVHPDFTLLNLRKRRECYWEHFGMMDDIEYRNNAFIKLRNYESHGYFPCNDLLWTFETAKYPLNTRFIRNMIKEIKDEWGY